MAEKEKSITKYTVAELWNEIRGRRLAMQVAEARYFLFVRQIELKRTDFWNPDKIEVFTFDQWLHSHHPNTPHTTVYRAFLKGVEHLGGDSATAEDIGVHATAELGRFKRMNKAALEEFLERSRNFRTVHDVHPSEETARGWRRSLDESNPRVNTSASKLAALELENRNLRAKLREKEAELKAVKMQLKEVDGRGSKKKTSTRSSASAGARS